MNPVFSYEKVIQPISEELKAEVIALWDREGAGITDLETRLAQVGFVARTEAGELAGVCSSTVARGIYNSFAFHSMRVLVATEFRQNLLAFELLAHLVEDFIDHRPQDTAGEPVGVKVVIESPIVAQRGAIFCSRTFQFPVNKAPAEFLLSGFTPKGHPEYCHYFRDELNETSPTDNDGETLVEKLNEELLNVYGEEIAGLLSNSSQPDIQPDLSKRTLYLLRRDTKLLAVCELFPRQIPELNTGLLGLHTTIAPKAGDIDAEDVLARAIFDDLADEPRPVVSDVVGLYQARERQESLIPISPKTGFHLHGVDAQGNELRVRFFNEVKATVPQ